MRDEAHAHIQASPWWRRLRAQIEPRLPQRRSLRVTLVVLIVATVLAGPTSIVLGPFLTLYRIQSAVDRHDAAALAALVDFATLRSRIKARFASAPAASDSLFATLVANARGRAVDVAAERLVTPETLSRLLRGRRIWTAMVAGPIAPAALPSTAALARVRFGWQGPTQFSLWVRDESDHEACLVLVLDGVTWKIGDVMP